MKYAVDDMINSSLESVFVLVATKSITFITVLSD